MSLAAQPAAAPVTVRAPAKINLFLGVGPVRDDGFHPLDTVYQAVSLYDDVTVSDADTWSVEVTAVGDVDVADVPLDESNLAVRAGRMLAEHHGLDACARIEIAKGIPVAGGMAGGSADAAATLVAIDRLWDLDTSDEDLLDLAGRLGSDVPFALVGGSAHGTGRGEVVEAAYDSGTWWWVVVPNPVGLSTPEVYRAFDTQESEADDDRSATRVLAALRIGSWSALADELHNDLEAPALALRPDLLPAREALTEAGAVPLLSGSGPTLLGLVRTQTVAQRVREVLIEAGFPALVATGPVAGTHVVEYV